MHHEFPAPRPVSHIATYNMAHDPARAAILPALNLMFLRRDLAPNPRRFTYVLDEQILFGRGPDSLAARRDIRRIYPSYEAASFAGRTSFITSRAEIKALRTRFPETEVVFPGDVPANLPDGERYPLVNGSGEIRLYWKDRFFLVTAGRTKMAMGYFGGRGEYDLGNGVRVNITTPGYACLIISSLTDDPVSLLALRALASSFNLAPNWCGMAMKRSAFITGRRSPSVKVCQSGLNSLTFSNASGLKCATTKGSLCSPARYTPGIVTAPISAKLAGPFQSNSFSWRNSGLFSEGKANFS